MAGDRIVSLPPHFCAWDVKRAATFRVLVHLWRFADNHDAEAWVFQTDAELIANCGLSNERQLRRCLADLREAGVLERENGPDGRMGFRLFNRAPDSGQKCPVTSDRSKVTAQPVKGDRPAGQKCPPHLLESRRAEEHPPTPHGGNDGAEVFELVSEAKPRVAPRRTRRPEFTAAERAEIGQVFEALCSARAAIADRLGQKPTAIKLVSRENAIAKALRQHGLDRLLESLRNRGDFGGDTALGILTNIATPFRPDMVKLALDRDELQRLSQRDRTSPEHEPVVRPMRVKL